MNTQSWPDGPISIPSPFPKYAQDVESYYITYNSDLRMWQLYCLGTLIFQSEYKDAVWSFLEGVLFGGVQ